MVVLITLFLILNLFIACSICVCACMCVLMKSATVRSRVKLFCASFLHVLQNDKGVQTMFINRYDQLDHIDVSNSALLIDQGVFHKALGLILTFSFVPNVQRFSQLA